MQIRIALCDDETACHDTAKSLLAEYARQTASMSCELSCFSSGRELLDCIKTNKAFDIYILDIIMPDLNGIGLGTALHYLLKPIDSRQFFQCMDKAVSRPDHPGSQHFLCGADKPSYPVLLKRRQHNRQRNL